MIMILSSSKGIARTTSVENLYPHIRRVVVSPWLILLHNCHNNFRTKVWHRHLVDVVSRRPKGERSHAVSLSNVNATITLGKDMGCYYAGKRHGRLDACSSNVTPASLVAHKNVGTQE